MELRDWITDPKLEIEGVWEKIAPEEDDAARVKIARMENPAYRKRAAELLEDYIPLIRNGGMPEDQQQRITIECIADAVLLDWEGVTDDGKPLECTRENKIRALTESRDFLNRIVALSADRARFRRKLVEGVSGN